MSNYTLELKNLTKIFGRRLVFKDINYKFETGKVYGIAGSNGSGKSTLSKLIIGISSPTSGKVLHKFNNSTLDADYYHNHVGFVSPYLVLYDEFSAEENIDYFSKIRGVQKDSSRISSLFEEFNLTDRKTDLLKGYSSGMKQRMKFIFALQHDPELLIFDEPTSNLDSKGKEAVYNTVNRLKNNKLIIIASNEDADLKLCDNIINVEEYKS
ncbi:MAG: ABC transporter ATP-binding protein [Melioribacteraceae bacterium]|nr:ABC transporter ATP-binding protein [Melioribacteraceae bacterium]